ncbi:CRISPR-associated protein Cas6/Cse3/CasE, subtype I-E/ECOLI [Corynebacterium mustelae]|uniref:CRISPR-associated protein Cas6/Cse3/CasE, subtype I-E/ECOLI n=1 Tax=Corynebacterium mustelae TaxID=571915 RepID=A0A0G3H215_9CORY|nr:type I-E CRISPR-associated protein Cas6/Cse3/CasE [Corynebacterium mustelae]AKK06790.1 CRISPR-associated protein Cas6/Cse3/CasE, subtype I-E/ECOLI [Corynebacterium mustelae]
MPYLSTMELNGQRRQTAKFLANPRTMHAAIESCFPSTPDEGNPRVLWRLERHGSKVTLWLVSERQPSFEHIQEQAGWSAQPTWETRNYDLLLDRLMTGQYYQFRLTANPVICTVCEDGKKRHVGLVREPDQINWLLARQENLGISVQSDPDSVPTFSVSRSKRVRFPHKNKQTYVTIDQCQFDGVLTVTDPNALRTALIEGIGRSKAYGSGLLTLATYKG